jgi:hypothetical protein
MPMIKGKKYPYTKEGIAAAKLAEKKMVSKKKTMKTKGKKK